MPSQEEKLEKALYEAGRSVDHSIGASTAAKLSTQYVKKAMDSAKEKQVKKWGEHMRNSIK